MIDPVDEPEERLVAVIERRGLEIGHHPVHERFVTEQLRRNCGVGLDSKRAVVALRRVSRDELAHPRAER
jgi:hypothetical protein